jgi:hypothetical protein
MADPSSNQSAGVPGGEPRDTSSYITDSKDTVPVQSDDAQIDDPKDDINEDSDQQLGIALHSTASLVIKKANNYIEQDEKDAVDKSNIIQGRTRGAHPKEGDYAEPSDKVPGVDS